MAFGYQQQTVHEATAARASIENLNARHNRLYSAGDKASWVATFKHSGATLTVDGRAYSKIWEAFSGGHGTLVTLDHDITVDGVHATQRAVAMVVDDTGAIRGLGTFSDTLIYERGGWYYAARSWDWTLSPQLSSFDT